MNWIKSPYGFDYLNAVRNWVKTHLFQDQAKYGGKIYLTTAGGDIELTRKHFKPEVLSK